MGFMYSFGLSTWIIYSMMLPIQFQAIQENVTAVLNGDSATLINTVETATAWIWLGGTGATLPLVVLMAFRAQSARLKAIGRAALVPSIFNINEPVVFGAPIAFNPILMIPMWINSLVPPILVYLTLHFGLIPVPSKIFQMWYMPIPIATWIISPGLLSLLLVVVIIALTSLVWFPFFRAYDKQAVKEDEEEAILSLIHI